MPNCLSIRTSIAAVMRRYAGETKAIWRNWTSEDFGNMVRPRKPAQRPILCQNDYTAYGAIDVLNTRGLQVGRDLSLVGYDNSEAREGLGDGKAILTTIDRPADLLGRRAPPSSWSTRLPMGNRKLSTSESPQN